MIRLPVLLVGLLLAVAGCGSTASSTDDAGSPTTPPTSSAPTSSAPTSSAPTSPSSSPTETVPGCATVWVDGQVLPGTYHGCLDDAGKKVRGRPIYCEQGNRLYLYDGQFYALANQPVHRSPNGLKNDHAFRVLVRDCTG